MTFLNYLDRVEDFNKKGCRPIGKVTNDIFTNRTTEKHCIEVNKFLYFIDSANDFHMLNKQTNIFTLEQAVLHIRMNHSVPEV